MSRILLVLTIVFVGGIMLQAKASGQHPYAVIRDASRFVDNIIAGSDPMSGVPRPSALAAGSPGSEILRTNLRFYDNLTAQYAAQIDLGRTCGRAALAPGAKAYVVSLAESERLISGPEWENSHLPRAGVATVHVEPGDHQKILYVIAKAPTVWSITGAPSAIYVHGGSYIGKAPAGVPVYYERRAAGCKTRKQIEKEVDNNGADSALAVAGALPATTMQERINRARRMVLAKNEFIDKRIVRQTSNAPIQEYKQAISGLRFEF